MRRFRLSFSNQLTTMARGVSLSPFSFLSSSDISRPPDSGFPPGGRTSACRGSGQLDTSRLVQVEEGPLDRGRLTAHGLAGHPAGDDTAELSVVDDPCRDIRDRASRRRSKDILLSGCLLYTSPSPRDRNRSRM